LSSYYEAIRRISPVEPDDELRSRSNSDQPEAEGDDPLERGGADVSGDGVREPALSGERRLALNDEQSTAVVPLPTLQGMPVTMARAEPIQRLTERLAPLAVVEKSMRIALSGCRHGDGASTLACAFALDLSQRLSVRTLLVDAHIRHPALHRMFPLPDYKPPELILNGALQIRSSGWPRLELASCCLDGTDKDRRELLEHFENVLSHYSAVVIDLGVARLDTRMLPLARPADPILLVTRYGHTRRHELATTAAALRAANRAVAGVILNAAASTSVKKRKLISK
jgi:Mrp family chromosome partitioning ATPase